MFARQIKPCLYSIFKCAYALVCHFIFTLWCTILLLRAGVRWNPSYFYALVYHLTLTRWCTMESILFLRASVVYNRDQKGGDDRGKGEPRLRRCVRKDPVGNGEQRHDDGKCGIVRVIALLEYERYKDG